MKTMVEQNEFRSELLPHPDSALSDCYLFTDLKGMLTRNRFGSNEEMVDETDEAKDKSFQKKALVSKYLNRAAFLSLTYFFCPKLPRYFRASCSYFNFAACLFSLSIVFSVVLSFFIPSLSHPRPFSHRALLLFYDLLVSIFYPTTTHLFLFLWVSSLSLARRPQIKKKKSARPSRQYTLSQVNEK